MSSFLKKILLIDIFRYHKTKIALTALFCVIIFVMIFPFSDLSDFVTDQISTQTQGRVFVQFGDLDFGLLPTLSVTGEDVLVETAGLPTIPIKRFTVWPSVMSLITANKNPNQIPHFSMDAEGVFGGNLEASLGSGKGSNKEIPMTSLQFEGDKLNLDKVAAVAQLPIKLIGVASFKGQVNFDPTFQIQPEGDVQVQGAQVQIPPGNIPSQLGPIFIPGFSWGELLLKGRVSNGTLYLDDATLGKQADALYARVKGQMGLPIHPGSGAQVTTFDLKIDLQVNPTVAKELGTFLGFIDKYKVASGSRSRYLFRAVSTSPGAPPNLLPQSSF